MKCARMTLSRITSCLLLMQPTFWHSPRQSTMCGMRFRKRFTGPMTRAIRVSRPLEQLRCRTLHLPRSRMTSLTPRTLRARISRTRTPRAQTPRTRTFPARVLPARTPPIRTHFQRQVTMWTLISLTQAKTTTTLTSPSDAGSFGELCRTMARKPRKKRRTRLLLRVLLLRSRMVRHAQALCLTPSLSRSLRPFVRSSSLRKRLESERVVFATFGVRGEQA
mmetsp:Transcript_6988/g.16339  ORF Transcript_6988/g.16339 Transcript_6988/m.16339 type:complete len:221 (-) Transcript_6988:210-872(-)